MTKLTHQHKKGKSTAQPARPPSVFSLFCGAGGLDLGFQQAGYSTIFAADYMKAAIHTFNHNLEADVASQVDLLTTSPRKLVDQVEARARKAGTTPKGLIGGPPCQGVSNANTSAGPNDPRNALFSRYVRILREADRRFSLDFFVLENVPGLRADKNRELYDGLKRSLSRDFHLAESILDASHYGVPQTRRRLIMVGISKRLDAGEFAFPAPTTADNPIPIREVLAGLPHPDYLVRGSSESKSEHHPNHWTMRPVSRKFLEPEDKPNSRSFLRLEWSKPSRTVAYGNREIHIHPDGNRRLSIFEALKLQGFPESFVLTGNFSEQVTQVSNAVPPPVAKAIASSLFDLLYQRP